MPRRRLQHDQHPERPEVLALLARVAAGDRTAEAELVPHYRCLVWRIARKQDFAWNGNTGVDIDDLYQAGLLGLLKAFRTYDPSRKLRLSTWASFQIRAPIQRLIRSQQQCRRFTWPTPPPSPFDYDDPPEWDPADRRSDAPDLLAALSDEEASVKRLLRRLSPRQRQVLRLRYGLAGTTPHTLAEAGRVLGVTKERIRQIEHRAIKTLREVHRCLPCSSTAAGPAAPPRPGACNPRPPLRASKPPTGTPRLSA